MTIRNKMLAGFLAISLVPILITAVTVLSVTRNALSNRAFSQLENLRDVKQQQVISFFSEKETDLAVLLKTVDGLRSAAFNKLQTVQENKKAQIHALFDRTFRDMTVLSKSLTVPRAIKDFSTCFQQDTGEPDPLLYRYYESEKYGDSLLQYSRIYGYYDLLLVTREGRVVYSSRKESELGRDIRKGDLGRTGLGAVFRKGLVSLNFQDFEAYAPAQGRYIAFIGHPVMEKGGKTIGVVILKITNHGLNEITSRKQGMGRTGETFLAHHGEGGAILRTRGFVRGGKIGDLVLGDGTAPGLGPSIRIGNNGSPEIAASEPVIIDNTRWTLTSRMALSDVIAPTFHASRHDYFVEFIKAYGYRNLYLVSRDGLVFYSARERHGISRTRQGHSGNGLARLYEQIKAHKEMAFQDFSLMPGTSVPSAFIGAPLIHRGIVEMIVALELPVSAVNRIMKTREAIGRTGDIYLVGPDRLLRSDSFILPDSWSAVQSFKAPEARQVNTLPSRNALGGITGKATAQDYRSVQVLSAYAPLDILGTRWAILSEIDRDEAFSYMGILTLLVVLGSLVTAAAIFFLSFVTAKRFAAPINVLTDAAVRLKKKDFSTHVDIRSNDEFRVLAEAFNAMTETVRAHAVSLEQKILQLGAAEKEARQNEERFRSLVETTSDWIWEVDENACYTYVSPKINEVLGYSPSEIVGKTPFDLMPEEEKEKIAAEFQRIVSQTLPFDGLENVNVHKDGFLVVMETSGVPFFNEAGRFKGYRGIDRDITSRKKYEETLLLTESVFTNTIEGIAVTDREASIQRVNQAFTDITGYPAEEALGQNPRILKSDRHTDQFYRDMWNDLTTKGQWSGEIWNRRKDGTAYPEWLSISAIYDNNGDVTNYVSLFHDISERKVQEEKLAFLAFHDPLTRLPNRKLFYDRANTAIKNAARTATKVALLYMDIDNFKNINDAYGHPFGDEFLCRVKDLISSVCRESDTFARYGGDEFVIVLNNITGPRQVMNFADRILAMFASPVQVNGVEVFSSMSIGLAIFPDDGDDLVTLEKNADMALYKAKQEGKTRSVFFEQGLKAKMLRSTRLETEMRKEIGRFSNFHVVYQPKVNIKTNRIHGVEALLRWTPGGDFVSPGEFIPMAEETNLIIPVGEWLMKQAMTDMKSIHGAGYPDLVLSINLSFKQFTDQGLFNTIRNTLQSTGYEPERLCFEITESTPMENADRSVEIMEKLSSMGITLSMDDFGTGYSSLSMLKRFPLKELKIDRSFIMDIPDDPNDAAISKAIIQMSEILNFDVVAEGVETRDQLRFLEDNGCYIIQGYLFYKPLPPDELLSVLKKH